MSSKRFPLNGYAINLDGVASSVALLDFANAMPDDCVPLAFRDYAMVKGAAMRAREQGRIADALAFEAKCDACYKRIPRAWRW